MSGVFISDGSTTAPGCVKCATCRVVLKETDMATHECLCPLCRHPHGPIAMPKDWKEEYGELLWTCPCECHFATARTDSP